MHGCGQTLHVVCVDTGHGDAAISGQVDAVLGAELVDHLTGHTREAEHSDLICDMVPGEFGAGSFQCGTEHGPHADDSVCHHFHFSVPA